MSEDECETLERTNSRQVEWKINPVLTLQTNTLQMVARHNKSISKRTESIHTTQYLDIDKKGIFNGISIELIM